MDRRDFLKSTGGAAALAAVAGNAAAETAANGGVPLAAPAVVTRPSLLFSMPWAENPAGYAGDGARLARRIEAALDGDVRLEIAAGATAGPDAGMRFAEATSRVADHAAFAFFAGLPGNCGLDAHDLDGWLASGGGQELWDDLAAAHGFKPLLAGHTGASPVLWSRRPLDTPQAMAGLNVEAQGLAADVVRGLGGVLVARSHRAALDETGIDDCDAIEWGSLVHAAAAGIPARFPYGLAGALSRAGSALSLEIDLPVWEKFPPVRQSAIAATVAAEFRAGVADTQATRRMTEAAMRTRFAVDIASPSEEFRSAVDRIAVAVVAHAAAGDAVARRVNASYAAYRQAIGQHDELARSLV